MNKWDKLNKKLDTILDNMSEEDWKRWDLQRKHISGLIKMNYNFVWKNDLSEGIPPEGIDVMTYNGYDNHIMYFLASGEYRWMNIIDDEEVPIPFEPTHWRFLTNEEEILNKLKYEK